MSGCTDKSDTSKGKAKLPSWIRAELFNDILKKLYNNYEEITDFSVENALAPGENYVTVMLKVEIKMKLKDSSIQPTSFMLKISAESQMIDEFMAWHDVFSVEGGMFRDIVPEFENLFTAAGMNVKFAAESYELPTKEKYILLENLKEQGFKNVNRLEGLDQKHTECVLKKLAQWHAASAVRVATKGPFPAKYCTGLYNVAAYDFIKNMLDCSTKPILECTKEYKNSELYYEKLAKLRERLTEEVYKHTDPDPSEFNVLNHGDLWSNNIMFKYDEQGNITETYFVDFQLPCYGSPIQDLFYLLLSSTNLKIKLTKFDYFIRFYHDHLVASLKQLNYSQTIPTLKEIHLMFFKYGIYGVLTAMNVIAVALCEPNENATLDNFINDSEDGLSFRKLMYSNARYRSHMEEILPWLLNKGLLDC